MSRHRSEHRRTPLGLASVLVVATVVLLATTVGGSYALFTDTAAVNAGPASSTTSAFTSGSIATPTVNKPSQAAGGVVITWADTTVGTGGAKPDGYEIYRYSTATGGTAVLACAKTLALTCTDDDAMSSATVYYELRAYFYTWTKSSARVTYTDVTGPGGTITQPSANGSATSLRSQVAACSPTGIACGSSRDPGGVRAGTIEFSLLRTVAPRTWSCWSGSAWGSSPDDQCDTYFKTSGTAPAWVVPGTPATAYPNNVPTATYRLQIRATDSFGNVSTTFYPYSIG